MPLQIALFLASVAIVIFVMVCIPVMLQLRNQAVQAAQSLAELKAEVSLLVQDSRKMLAGVHDLAVRVHAQVADAEQVLQAVRGWTTRVDRVVEEVGAAIAPPILTAARNFQVVYKGIAKFFETFLNRN